MDGTGILFAPLLKQLDKRIRPVVVQYPPDKPMSYNELLPIISQAIPENTPFILLGESFSGPLAIMKAAEYPKNLVAVVLVATFIKNPLPWLPAWTRLFAITPVFWLTKHFIVSKALVSGYGKAEMLALLDMAHGMVKASVMAKRAKDILSVNVEADLKKIKAPIYFIGGKDDKVVPRLNLRKILGVRLDVKPRLIPGPHLILQVNPRESAEVIKEIMKKEKAL